MQQRIESAFGVTHVTHRSVFSLFSPYKDVAGVRMRLDVTEPKPHKDPYPCHHCPRRFNLKPSRGKHIKSCPDNPSPSSFPVGGGTTEADRQWASEASARNASRVAAPTKKRARLDPRTEDPVGKGTSVDRSTLSRSRRRSSSASKC